jgi:sec-independent protein translocase protein TatA
MLSIPDMALLGAAALMFFGPEQLPKVARKVGILVRDVQNTSQSFIREMERAGEDYNYTPDISRAHLLEDPVPPSPVYEPPAHDPYLGEPLNGEAWTHPYGTAEPESTPVPASPHHDIMPHRATSAPVDHDLPP